MATDADDETRAAVSALVDPSRPPADELGVVTNVCRAEDDQGRTVLRATVDFYDGNAPALTFRTVWEKIPVTIIEVK